MVQDYKKHRMKLTCKLLTCLNFKKFSAKQIVSKEKFQFGKNRNKRDCNKINCNEGKRIKETKQETQKINCNK